MKKNYSSETGLIIRSCNIKQDKREAQNISYLYFLNWFVGFTDGDGCFNIYIDNKNNKVIFTFKISQNNKNIQALYYIKKNLKHGIVSKIDSYGMVHYLIRRQDHLNNIICTLFQYIPLRTIKNHDFLLFKQCLSIYMDSSKSQHDKILEIKKLKENPCPTTTFLVVELNKAWLAGFIEADGSFYITKKEEGRLSHGFGITQKHDKHILYQIKNLFLIDSKVKLNKGGNSLKPFWSLDATGYKSLKRIKDYFFKSFKGNTSLYYRIWSRSFKHKGKYEKLLIVQRQLKKLRKN